MAYDYSKRISALKEQTDEERAGLLSFGRAFFAALCLATLLLFGLSVIFPSDSTGVKPPKPEPVQETNTLDDVADRLRNEPEATTASDVPPPPKTWQERTKLEIQERYAWLSSSLLGETVAQRYLAFSEYVIDVFVGPEIRSFESSFDMGAWIQEARLGAASMLLRAGFLVIGYWYYWIIAAIAAYFGSKFFYKPIRTNDMLGICNPWKGPYYSGVWGKFSPNHSVSGTDFACPSLACPNSVSKAVAQKHKVYSILQEFDAVNQTNLGLLQVILAYKKYPTYVPEERAAEEQTDLESGADPDAEFVSRGVASTDCMTIEEASIVHVQAVLEAHGVLKKYAEMVERTGELTDEEAHYERYNKAISHVADSLSPLGAVLLQCLTPALSEALVQLPATAVATACLALEAGKVLTFDEIEPGVYTQTSLFPHLQARAVMQSVGSYVHEYDGDMRYQIRQAIYCSRRHGDFGRTFLPMGMLIPSRALRDWLEVLYASEDARVETAHLVELDAHIHELHVNWRAVLGEKIRSMLGRDHAREIEADPHAHLWLGVPFKSVVLMPLRGLLRVSLSGISTSRLKRIHELIELTRGRTQTLSMSAGLPGFKRQAEEVLAGGLKGTGVTRKLADNKADREIAEQWLVVRRMLTKYNWLSTRVGDDAVPVDGLLQGIITTTSGAGAQPDVIPLDALVPLRQRRYSQILGDSWVREYFGHAPHERDVSLVLDSKKFETLVAERVQKVKSESPADTSAASAS